MHEGSCHCGAVRMKLPSTPEVATACNCSKCRRIGGPWVYFEYGTVEIQGHPEATAEYIWQTKRCAPSTAGRVGVSHTGNHCSQLLAASTASTSATSILS